MAFIDGHIGISPMTPAALRARYVDITGRRITDPETIRARYIQQQLARLQTISYRRGSHGQVTVADLAKETKLMPSTVVEVIRSYDMWLWGIDDYPDKPIEEWKVYLDGE